MIGFTAGSNLLAHPPFAGARAEVVHTDYGPASVYRGPGFALILRHGPEGNVPPHRIEHRANVACWQQLGVKRTVAFCSVGSLRPELRPGLLVVPEDYINLWPVLTFFDREARHVTPGLDEGLRRLIMGALEACGEEYHDGGVYFQTTGPRLETRAEVRLIAQFADVVGMTFGHEATLCNEADIGVAALCSVDNMAHGLDGDERPDADEIARAKERQAARLAAVAQAILQLEAEP